MAELDAIAKELEGYIKQLEEHVNKYQFIGTKVLPVTFARWIEIGYKSIKEEIENQTGRSFPIPSSDTSPSSYLKLARQMMDFIKGWINKCIISGEKKECPIPLKEENKCFVVYDFSLRGFDKAIEEAFEHTGIEPIFAQKLETWSVPAFCERICAPLKTSKFVIADISKPNINVGLEIGMAWRFNKNLLITINKKKIERGEEPFDLKFAYYIVYENCDELKDKLKRIWKGN